MKPEEAEKLLGGYATGSLTDEEREVLFAAAIDDQKLFDSLADEEALRELLADNAYRQELIAALAETRPTLSGRIAAWWQRPASLAWAGGAAAVLLAAVVVYRIGAPPAETDIAMVTKQETAAPVVKENEEAGTITQSVSEGEAEAPSRQSKPEPAERALVELFDPALREKKASAKPESEPPPPTVVTSDDELDAPAEEATFAMADALEERALAPPPAPAKRKMVALSRAREPAGLAGAAAPSQFRKLTAETEAGQERPRTNFTIERASADGTWSEVASTTAIGLGETIRLRVEAPADGFLYVFDPAATGPERTLFGAPVIAGQRYLVPAEGSLRPPANPGPRRLEVMLTTGRVAANRPLGQSGVTALRMDTPAPEVAEITIEYAP